MLYSTRNASATTWRCGGGPAPNPTGWGDAHLEAEDMSARQNMPSSDRRTMSKEYTGSQRTGQRSLCTVCWSPCTSAALHAPDRTELAHPPAGKWRVIQFELYLHLYLFWK